MNKNHLEALREKLAFIYPEHAEEVLLEVQALLKHYRHLHPVKELTPSERLSEKDIFLITYGDQIRSSDIAPLQTLHSFLKTHVGDAVTGVHFLPFFPYTSDDGFSVVDYYQIDPAIGDWDDVKAIGQDYRLMFDAVINHISASSTWFQGFLKDESPFTTYFITEDPDTDLSMIVRPRTSPLLTPFETRSGMKHVWTTFSADQVDLNFENPQVLLEIIHVLLEYAAKGATIIRLDAVTYLWKEVGHESVHHPKTHAVLQLLRTVFELAAPQVVMLTETNVPHAENIAYFGDGTNEAQMVYNFALPPLVLHSFLKEDASALQSWARTLDTPSDETTFFNFLASHDGIGVRSVESILGQESIKNLVENVKAHGGLISYKTNSDGSQSAYELNISFFDALNNPSGSESLELQISKFLCAQSILLTLAGVPGIYIHSLLGSRNFYKGVKETGRNRSINRQKFEREVLEKDLADTLGLRPQVLEGMKKMLNARQSFKAFHPQAPQEVLETQAEVFGLRRFYKAETLYCLHNVSGQTQTVKGLAEGLTDVFTGKRLEHRLEPFGFLWGKA